MKRFEDPNGLIFTATNAESASGFAELTSAYMGFQRNTGKLLGALRDADPDMPMALCAQGSFAKLMGSSNHSARAVTLSDALQTRLSSLNATDRERQHAAALSAWTKGDMNRATDIWEAILLDHPQDGLALRLAHFTHFYSGDGRRIRDSLARTLPRWSEDHPDYGFLLGMYAFGLEESGEYEEAEKYGRRAVDMNPADAWSVHSVAHVLEMTGRHADGIAWVAGLEDDWSTVNNFRYHLHWHRSLYHLERGEFDVVLDLYDRQIVSDITSDFYLDICNASSLLWRLEMFGVDVGDRWRALADVARTHIDDADLIFVSLHYLMALVSAGDAEAADEMIENIRKWSTLGDTQAVICANVGVALAEGLRAARSGDFATAASKIGAVRYQMDAIGGSAAQRDVFHMILLDATAASQNALQARALFRERLGYKVHSSWTWHGYSNALATLGDDNGAETARDRAAALQIH
ncbi:MAG: tetratricopeptide repeat protein [Rhodobacteraceae bacterium]|nr:tetratricopeptide repeat protein [Paracoccaceae bacterium]